MRSFFHAKQSNSPKHTYLVLFSQFDLQGRVVQTDSDYDPVAERILINLLTP